MALSQNTLDILARQGSLTPEATRDLAKYNFENPNSQYARYGTQFQAEQGGSFLDWKNVATTGTLENKLFGVGQPERIATETQKAYDLFKTGTGIDVSQVTNGDPTWNLAQAVKGGKSAEEAIAGIGSLSGWAKFGQRSDLAGGVKTGQTPQDLAFQLSSQQKAYDFAQNLPKPAGTITPGALKEEQKITLPKTSEPSPLAETGIVGAGSSIAEIMKSLQTPATPEETKQQTLLNQMTSLIGDQTNKAAEQLTAEQSAKLPELKSQFADINAQIISKTAEYNVYKAQQEGKPITMERIFGSITEAQSRISSEAIFLKAQAEGLQGKIEQAQATVNRAIELKYSTITNKLNIYQAQLNALQPILNKQEKLQSQAQQILLDRQKQALSDKKATEKQQSDYLIDLMSKYRDAKISFSDSLEDAQLKIPGSKIYQKDVELLKGKGTTTSSGALWTPITTTPTTKQTFEQYLTEQENKTGQSFSQAKRDELKKQFETTQVVPTANAQTTDLSNYSIRVQQALLGTIPMETLYSGGTKNERDLIEKQLKDAQSKGLLTQKFSGYQTKLITSLNESVSKNTTYSKTNSMRGFADNITASLSQNTGVGDIAAINQFQKVIDEGAVTRDQDVKLIQSSQSFINTLKTKITKLEKGEQLSPELRTQMRIVTESIYEAQVKALKKDPFINSKIIEAKNNNIPIEETILGLLSAFEKQDEFIGGVTGQTSTNIKYTIIQK